MSRATAGSLPSMERGARQALATLREAAQDGRLDGLCDRLGLDLVSVFGSTVRSATSEPGDLDIAVRFRAGAARDPLRAVEELIRLLRYDNVDVLDLAGAGVVARARALGADSEPLYERDPGGYALAQIAALTVEMETEHLRRLDLRLLSER